MKKMHVSLTHTSQSSFFVGGKSPRMRSSSGTSFTNTYSSFTGKYGVSWIPSTKTNHLWHGCYVALYLTCLQSAHYIFCQIATELIFAIRKSSIKVKSKELTFAWHTSMSMPLMHYFFPYFDADLCQLSLSQLPTNTARPRIRFSVLCGMPICSPGYWFCFYPRTDGTSQ